MKAITKGVEPRSLTQHRCNTHSDYDNYDDKDGLREALVAEQGGICCYCMQRIRSYAAAMKIEHWHCQENYSTEQLDYRNLLGACMGNEGEPRKEQHCDTFKGKKDLSRNPANPAHRIEEFIRYLGDGTIESPDPAFNAELKDVLNLNRPIFVNNRKAVLDSFQKGLPPGKLSQQELQRKLDEWNGTICAELKPYCGVVIYWLRKKLR